MRLSRRAATRTSSVWICVLAMCPAAAAQAVLRIPPVEPTPSLLTIDDAVHEALDRNLTLLAERYSVSVAQARVLAASLRPNPVFTYTVLLPDAAIYDTNVNPRENVFRTDVVFEGGGKRERRIEVAEQARSVAELQVLNTMRTAGCCRRSCSRCSRCRHSTRRWRFDRPFMVSLSNPFMVSLSNHEPLAHDARVDAHCVAGGLRGDSGDRADAGPDARLDGAVRRHGPLFLLRPARVEGR